MKVNFGSLNNYSNVARNKSVSFGSGVTNIFSDFDGTFMPVNFNQDSMVKNNPPLDKAAFASYFAGFQKLLDALKGSGSNPKLNFSIITGRNIHEFNYIVQKIKDHGLVMPLADRLISSNGGDIYVKRQGAESFYSTSSEFPYLMENFDASKVEWVKNNSGGWNGKKVKKQIEDILNNTNIIPRNLRREELFGKILIHLSEEEKKAWYKDLIEKERTQEQLITHLQQSAKPLLDNSSDEHKNWLYGEIDAVGAELFEAKNGKYKFQIFTSGTNQCGWTYPNTDATFQSQFESLSQKPRYYASFRNDGELNIHLSFPWREKEADFFMPDYDLLEPEFSYGGVTPESLKRTLNGDNGAKINLQANAKTDGESFNAYGKRTSAFRLRPVLNLQGGFLANGGVLDKMHDVQRKAKEIVDNNLNDLVITSGDGSNDLKMLDLASYMSVDKMDWNNKTAISELRRLPIISIYVKNHEIKGFDPYKTEELYNADGIVRYIIVDKSNPSRPQNLQEAIEVATKEFAKRNPAFKKNLSNEMRKRIEQNDYNYPAKTLVNVSKDNILDAIKGKKKLFAPIIVALGAVVGVITTLKVKNSKQKEENIGNLDNSANLNNSKVYVAMNDFMKQSKK